MRTSASQFEALVGFMERHGDLNRPAEGPRGRLRALELWEDLANLLNLDVAGDSKSIEKWKKVWSDYKNYAKRKAQKIQGSGSSGLVLSELEQRVLRLMNSQGGIDVKEIAYVDQNSDWPEHVSGTDTLLLERPVSPKHASSDDDIKLKDLEMPHGSGQSTPVAWEMSVDGGSAAASPNRAGLSPRPKPVFRRRITHRREVPRRAHPPPHPTTRPSSDSDHRFRQMLRVFATEHLRLRRRELDQQAQWQVLFSKVTDVLNKFLDK